VVGVDIGQTRAYQGQFITTDQADGDEEIELIRDFDDDNDFIDVTNADDGFAFFATDDLETSETYSFVNASGDEIDNIQITANRFSADWNDDSVDNQGETTTSVELDANRGTYDVHVTAEGLDNDDLDDIFGGNSEAFQTEDGILLESVSDGDFDADFDDIDAGDYEFEFDMTDTVADASSTITVEDGEDADVEFVEDTVDVAQGDSQRLMLP